jgi:Flp pilus assembly protein TadB
MQQDQRRFSLARRWLFPYNGEEPLTREQGRRVIVTWMFGLSIILTICTLPVVVLFGSHATWLRLVIVLLAIFLLCVFTFGMSAWLVVLMVNRSARFTHQWKQKQEHRAIESDTASGG